MYLCAYSLLQRSIHVFVRKWKNRVKILQLLQCLYMPSSKSHGKSQLLDDVYKKEYIPVTRKKYVVPLDVPSIISRP